MLSFYNFVIFVNRLLMEKCCKWKTNYSKSIESKFWEAVSLLSYSLFLYEIFILKSLVLPHLASYRMFWVNMTGPSSFSVDWSSFKIVLSTFRSWLSFQNVVTDLSVLVQISVWSGFLWNGKKQDVSSAKCMFRIGELCSNSKGDEKTDVNVCQQLSWSVISNLWDNNIW